MKKLIVSVALVAASSSYAQGFRCRTNCIVINQEETGVAYFGEVKASGSRIYFTRESLFAKLQDECDAFAYTSIPFQTDSGTSILVDALTASAYRLDSVGRRKHENKQNLQIGPVITDPTRPSVHYSDYEFYSHPSSGYGEWREPRSEHEISFDIAYWMADEKSACRRDASIPDDEVPVYDGDQPIEGD